MKAYIIAFTIILSIVYNATPQSQQHIPLFQQPHWEDMWTPFNLPIQFREAQIPAPVPPCLRNPIVTIAPDKDIYSPGDTVKIKFKFDYERVGRNWLQGIGLDFTDSWKLIEVQWPEPCADGEWIFWSSPSNDVFGVFYDSRMGTVLLDGNPTNNYGDDCQDPTAFPYRDHFEFIFTMVVTSCEFPGTLYIEMDTYSDTEYGVWSQPACEQDSVIVIKKFKNCLQVGIEEPPPKEHRGSFKIYNLNGQELKQIPHNVAFFKIWSNGVTEKQLIVSY